MKRVLDDFVDETVTLRCNFFVVTKSERRKKEEEVNATEAIRLFTHFPVLQCLTAIAYLYKL